MTSRAVAILGTGSDVGKSLVAAGICRVLHRAGISVAPFKAQNMSLNSFVTSEGGEMGRAQVLQAKACGLAPHVDMNPILLKPEADQVSQVIVHGQVWRTQNARTYFEKGRSPLWRFVQSSYERLANIYDVIVIEGAGSAAELNLRDRDLVNWPVVHLADAAVILVADIDRGGVFAQVIGTIDLLRPEERRRVIGVVINKFRGDRTLFDDGVRMLEQRTGVPVLGVLPYLRNLELDQEDSVDIERSLIKPFDPETVNIAVVLLPHMSNFTDFNQLNGEPDVVVRYAARPQDLQGADVVMLPGSKTTLADLEYIKKNGLDQALISHVQEGGETVGICGGFQMLGTRLSDPHRVETGGAVEGLGFLQIETELAVRKKTVQVQARALHVGGSLTNMVEGYEIHMGVTTSAAGVLPCFQILSPELKGKRLASPQGSLHGSVLENGEKEALDGARNPDGRVWGTYIHGVFDQPGFRRQWLNQVRIRKGLAPLEPEVSAAVTQRCALELDRWADHLQTHLNLSLIFFELGVGHLAQQFDQSSAPSRPDPF